MQPAGVICEIMNEDGTMARRPQLERFAAIHRLKMLTIAELVRYRQRHDPEVVDEKETAA
jgi:3,4-dihydroxy 2-butanone 4-phosphate synthase/GTP cyclohydrolase II